MNFIYQHSMWSVPNDQTKKNVWLQHVEGKMISMGWCLQRWPHKKTCVRPWIDKNGKIRDIQRREHAKT